MRKILRSSLTAVVFVFLAGNSFVFGDGKDVVLDINVTRSINFTSDKSSFNLNFQNFQKGSITDTATVVYTLSGNSVTRMQDLILARVDQELPGIALQAQMGSYSKKSGDASLMPSKSGYVNLTTVDTGLADKIIDSNGGTTIDGTTSITYRASASEDLRAGQQMVTILVTFADN
jgi:hypothetical protein